MVDIKTVDDSTSIIDPLYQKQKEGITKMRTALLASTSDSSMSTSRAIQNITTMRIYHQMMRIIKYTELMDKLEDKLYRSIDNLLDTSPDDDQTLIQLLTIQGRLQKSMIESHKLLQPYLDIQDFNVVDLMPVDNENTGVKTNITMNPEERDKLRSNAQAILLQLTGGDDSG